MRAQETAVYNSEVAMGTQSLLFWHISQGGLRGDPLATNTILCNLTPFHLVEILLPRLLHQVTEILVDVNCLILNSLERNLRAWFLLK